MFQVDSLIMYGATGVCRIVDITSMQVEGVDKQYYVLKPLYQSGVIYAPCDNNKVSMRSVISAEEAKKYIDNIPDVQTEIYPSRSMQALTRQYQSMLDTHTVADLIKITKSIHLKRLAGLKTNKGLGQIDKKFKKRAEDLLYGELSVALGVTIDEVECFIQDKLESTAEQ